MIPDDSGCAGSASERMTPEKAELVQLRFAVEAYKSQREVDELALQVATRRAEAAERKVEAVRALRPVAWRTDEESGCMLFPTFDEACSYCYDQPGPDALFSAADLDRALAGDGG